LFAELLDPLHLLRVTLVRFALLRIERAVDQHLNNFRSRRRYVTGENLASGAIDRNVIAFLQRDAARLERSFRVVDLHARRATDADFSHLTRDQSSVRRNAASRGKNAFGS